MQPARVVSINDTNVPNNTTPFLYYSHQSFGINIKFAKKPSSPSWLLLHWQGGGSKLQRQLRDNESHGGSWPPNIQLQIYMYICVCICNIYMKDVYIFVDRKFKYQKNTVENSLEWIKHFIFRWINWRITFVENKFFLSRKNKIK